MMMMLTLIEDVTRAWVTQPFASHCETQWVGFTVLSEEKNDSRY